ncbi:hypothetical protein CONLIGDRAFT_690586 [Coniochaeta ligniaria NRRL 30616]|uniref:Uncharacterized protein n=1 Tax=Coniochaeta ligniaria NRRL 30616 TaxID=1408157 RepID=A0A1J7IBX0_9PEZI|nr:hypothetical protein CONLIGDRAFT_690586 [Coniochaeta ligniaria NRRL 30616]
MQSAKYHSKTSQASMSTTHFASPTGVSNDSKVDVQLGLPPLPSSTSSTNCQNALADDLKKNVKEQKAEIVHLQNEVDKYIEDEQLRIQHDASNIIVISGRSAKRRRYLRYLLEDLYEEKDRLKNLEGQLARALQPTLKETEDEGHQSKKRKLRR